jgi:hypothetical protein
VTTLTNSATDTHQDRPRISGMAPWLAGLWAITYGALGLLHLLRDTVAPWTGNPGSVLASVSGTTAAAAICVVAALVLAALGGLRRVPRAAGWILLLAGLGVALTLADTRTLAFLGYLPMLLLGLLGIGPATHVSAEIWGGSMVSLGHSMGGLATVLAGVAALGWTAAGRRDPATVARWGRVAVALAVAVPAFYALTRLAWAVGVPLGMRSESLTDLGSARYAGLALALAALTGCALTLGLVQRWGERFWRWVPVVGGRPVPVGMAVVPALFVASAVISAGLGFWRLLLLGSISEVPAGTGDWAAWLPTLFWPIWGVALGVAALAYQRRRAGEL